MRRLATFLLMFLASAPVWGQETRGTILGTILDGTGAVVVGVPVTVTHVETNVSRAVTTNQKGYYEVSYLMPGTYTVTARAARFRAIQRSGLILALDQRLRVDIRLEVGDVSEMLTVDADAPMLDTTSADGSATLTTKMVMDLPVMANAAHLLMRSMPGVQWPGAANQLQMHSNLGASTATAAGGVGGTEFALDGVPNLGYENRTAYLPATDSIAEFKVDTAQFDASQGHTTGATLSMLTKSGTNDYRGTLTWGHWQKRLNATPTITNMSYWSAIRAAEAAGNTAKVNELRAKERQPSGHENTYAASLGGPVVIPGLVNGKDKLFFFVTFNGFKTIQTEESNAITYTVPSLKARQGDFSDLLALGTQYKIYDPRTARLTADGRVVRDPFPGNRVPILNPMYQYYLNLYPLPTDTPGIVTADGRNNYTAPAIPWLWNYWATSARLDWSPSNRHKLFGRFSLNDFVEDRYDWTFQTKRGLQSNSFTRHNFGATLDHVFTINSSTAWNTSVAYNRFIEGGRANATQASFKPSDVGLPAYMDELAGRYNYLPNLNFSDSGSYSQLSGSYPGVGRYSVATLRSELLKLKGTHSIRIGGEARANYRTQTGPGYTAGSFRFRNTYVREKDNTSNAPAIGLDWAAFMLGVPDVIWYDRNDDAYLTNPYYALYVQDDWRVNRKLALNLGLRYEFEGGISERFNRQVGRMDPTRTLPITAAVQAAYAAKPIPGGPASINVAGGVCYLGAEGCPDTLNPSGSYLLPRVGVVYQLNDKTVVRAGYGMFYNTINVLTEANAANILDQSGYSRNTTTTGSLDRGLTFVNADLPNGRPVTADPFPIRADGTRYNSPLGNSLGISAKLGGGYDSPGSDWRHGRQHRWRAGIQRELTKNMTFEIAYLGSRTDQIPITVRLNALPAQYFVGGNVRNQAWADGMDAQVPNPFNISYLGSLATTDPLVYATLRNVGYFNQATVSKSQLLRPFPQYTGNVRNTRSSMATSKYDHIEATLNKRFSSGVALMLTYMRAWDRRNDWLPNEFDTVPAWRAGGSSRPHTLAVNGIFELPFGKDRRFLKGGLGSALLGGWQVSGIYHWISGGTVGDFGNLFWYGRTPADPLDPNDPAYKVIKLDDPTRARWFNVEPFLLPSAVALYPDWKTNSTSYGKVISATAAARAANYHRRVFPSRFDFLRAASNSQLDLSLSRSITLRAPVKLQLRVDLINALNHVVWSGPSTDITSTNFGVCTSQSNTPRWIQFQTRLTF